MVRDEKETVPEKVFYSGKEGVGLSFEKLDEKMQSWGRNKFGDRYARDLWRDELMDLKSLKLGTDELPYSADPVDRRFSKSVPNPYRSLNYSSCSHH